MAGSTGLEPAASGVTGRRSNQLNYDPEVFSAHSLQAQSVCAKDNQYNGRPRPGASICTAAIIRVDH